MRELKNKNSGNKACSGSKASVPENQAHLIIKNNKF
jgi:hypothetical protein